MCWTLNFDNDIDSEWIWLKWMGMDENGWKRSSHHHWGRGHFVTFSRSHQLSASSIILVSNIITNIMIISNNPDDCDEDVEKGALCRSIHPGRPHRRAAHPRQPGGPIMLMMSLMIMMMMMMMVMMMMIIVLTMISWVSNSLKMWVWLAFHSNQSIFCNYPEVDVV